MGKEFDKNIKEKLEGLHINYDDASWDSFEQKLDNAESLEEIEDLEFDQQIKDKIQDRLSFDFEEEHWQELSTRIDHDNELANRIYLFKIIELVILVLLAYSFFQIEPIKKPGKNLPLYAHSEIFKSIVADKVFEKVMANNAVVQDNLVRNNSLRTVILEKRAEEVLQLNYAKVTALVPFSIDNVNVEVSDLEDMSMAQTFAPVRSFEHTDVDHDLANMDLGEKSNQRDHLAINTLENESSFFIIPPAFVRKGKSRWLSVSSSADVNLVNTPPRNILNGKDNLLGASGVSGAITYGIKSGKNEIEVGLGYSYKNYDPDLVDVFDIDSNSSGLADYSLHRTSLNRIAFHIAQIPINYKRYVVDNRKWSVFMNLGLTQNFILYSDYSLTDELLAGLAKPWTYKKANSYLLRRTYYTGLFQNVETESTLKRRSSTNAPTDEFRTEGNIFANAFITSYTGLGIQRHLSFNHSLFLQAGYHHQFFGDKLGPNNDQINTFSFTLGTRYKI